MSTAAMVSPRLRTRLALPQPWPSRCRVLVVLLFAVIRPTTAWPQGQPLGSQFRVNTSTFLDQLNADVASDASGNFVVVWQSDPGSGPLYNIFAQRYTLTGEPAGPEFRVNTYTTVPGSGVAVHRDPSVARDASSNFVVVWQGVDNNQDVGYQIMARRFGGAGDPLGSDFRVNTDTFESKVSPSVATDQFGNFVVVWDQYSPVSGYNVYAQRFASSGVPLGGAFRVNTFTSFWQYHSSVAADSDGDFIIVWQSEHQTGFNGMDIFGQRFASSGAPIGPEFRVSAVSSNGNRYPSVSADSSGISSSFGTPGPTGARSQYGASDSVVAGFHWDRISSWTAAALNPTWFRIRPATSWLSGAPAAIFKASGANAMRVRESRPVRRSVSTNRWPQTIRPSRPTRLETSSSSGRGTTPFPGFGMSLVSDSA